MNAALRKHYYVIGHVIARISSSKLDSAYYVAMNGAVQSEKVEWKCMSNIILLLENNYHNYILMFYWKCQKKTL